MRKNNLAVFSVVSAIVAWVVGIPGIYFYYDFYYRFLDGVIMRRVALRPYGVWLGSCPSILFWVACVIAVVTGYIALRQTGRLASSGSSRSLASIAVRMYICALPNTASSRLPLRGFLSCVLRL